MGPIDFKNYSSGLKSFISQIDINALKIELDDLTPKYNRFPPQVSYLNLLIKDLKKIISATPVELNNYKLQFDVLLDFNKNKCTSNTSRRRCGKCLNCKNIKLSKEIQRILNYTRFIESLILSFAKSKFKTCYICNSQYATSVTKDNNHRNKAKFQFDHVLPKSIYPCFSISYYNLLPICSSCNSIKLHHDLGVEFHNSKKVENAFSIKLNPDSLAKYLNNPKLNLIVEIHDNYKYLSTYRGKKLSEKFDLKGIYNSHVDIIEELILRKLKYSDAYKDTLKNSFSKLFKNISIEERILLGTYSKNEGIHKRPMSKFLQDVDKQLDEFFQAKIKEIGSGKK